MEDQSCKTPRWRLLKSELNNLAPKAFLQKIQSADAPIIVDVRTAAEFASGYIEGAVNISYLSDDFWEQIEVLDATKDVFVYCRTGRRSIRACTLMRNGGFDNEKIFNLEGGYALWLEEVGTKFSV